ncbi:MAG: hypothetical protein COA79_16495 [Planctomycetota bacterium]|nr:MAG: hypothetical protein COA79_16495 [Planctomycetota bacterium]
MSTTIQKLDSIGEKITDYLSPLTIKEVRQSLKGKLFLSSFLLGIVACLIPTIGFAASGSSVLGPSAFMTYSVIMFIGICVIFPYLAFSSLHEDRLNSTFELVGITNLNSYQLVWGKWQSSLVQVSLFVSSILPFLTYSYFLRGLSILSILGIIVVAFFLSQIVNLLAILAASLSHLKSNRLTFYFIFVFFLAGGYSISIGVHASIAAMRGGVADFLNNFWSNSDRNSLLIAVFIIEWFLYELAAGQLAPATANRSSRCRYSLFALFSLILIWICVFLVQSTHGVSLYELSYFNYVSVAILICAVFIMGESDELSQVLFKKYTNSRGASSAIYNIFFIPGRSSGYFFLMGILFSYLLVYIAFGSNMSFLLYFSNAVFWLSLLYLINILPYNKYLTAPLRRTATIAIVAVLLFVPTIIFLFLDNQAGAILNYFNPSFFKSNSHLSEQTLLIGNAISAVVLFLLCFIRIRTSKKEIQTVRKFDAGERGATQ